MMTIDGENDRERVSEPDSQDDRRGKGLRGSLPWNPAAVYRFVGLGMELAGFTLCFAGIGYLMDQLIQFPKPYGTAAGALIGFALGMIRFIVQVRQNGNR